MKDVDSIWESIYKPDVYKTSKYTDFFDIEFFFMPHKLFFEEQFTEKCKEMKERFRQESDNTLFPSAGADKNVPVDGLTFYIDQTWQTIKEQKDLNLPDQREMVAEYRCN